MSIYTTIENLGDVVCLDMETAMAPFSFQGREWVRLLQLHSERGEVYYDLAEFSPRDWDELRDALERETVRWVGQNIAFDYRCLLGCGIRLRGPLEDTMIQSQLLHNGLPNISHSLQAIVQRVLKKVVDKSLQTQDWMGAELNAADLAYAMGDVRLTYEVWQEQRAQIKTAGLQRVYGLECALIPVVVEMEHTGMLFDMEQAETAILRLEEEIGVSKGDFLSLLDAALLEAKGPEGGLPREEDGSFNLRAKNEGRGAAKKLAGFNCNSPVQVLNRLRDISIEPVDPKTGKPTTDKKVLRPLADNPVIFSLLTYKRAEKRRSMIQAWVDDHVREDGRIRARFSPLATGTGRFSCSSPNLQQVPREAYIRDCFVAASGHELVVMDVKNMEMGVACSSPIANEARMQHALSDGLDLHTFTSHLIFKVPIEEVQKEQRQRGKSCNFGLLFGSGAHGLRDYFASFGTSITIEEAIQFRAAWLEAYPAMAEWHRRAKWEVDRGTAEVRMVDGRRRWLVGDQVKPTVWLNNQVQGTAASIVKLTMVKSHPQLPHGCRFIAQIHDELIVEAPKGAGEEVLDILKTSLFHSGREILGDSVDMLGEGSVAASWGAAK